MTTKKIAKRKLTDVSFQHEGAHVALVSKTQGGPANGVDYALVMKSNYSQEFIQKVQQVKVTLELPEFLRRFFYMYGEDAEILAAMMGYVEPPEDEAAEAADEMKSWIEERMSAFEIIKSLNESENVIEKMASLSEEEYLSVLKDQEMLEKAFKKVDKLQKAKNTSKPKKLEDEGSTKAVAKAKELDETKTKVEPSINLNKGKQMEELELVQKALEEQRVELQKARDLLATYEAEKKEAVRKARFELLKAAVKNDATAELLFKAVSLVEDDTEFNSVVKALGEMQSAVEKSALFAEQGASTENTEEPVQESSVAKVLKARHSK